MFQGGVNSDKSTFLWFSHMSKLGRPRGDVGGSATEAPVLASLENLRGFKSRVQSLSFVLFSRNTSPCLLKMLWPSWAYPTREGAVGNSGKDDVLYEDLHEKSVRNSISIGWSDYLTRQTVVGTIILTATALGANRVYKSFVRRIPNASHLKPGSFRKRSIYGLVTRVGDGDGFHLFHTPGGRLLGWGWAPGRRTKDLMKRGAKPSDAQTITVRIAGIDAPERAHFGNPEQPYAKEALEWLKAALLGKYVRVYPYRQDQYQRIVASAYVWRWLIWRQDVGLNMLKQGLATVYEAKVFKEFGGNEEQYRVAEERAKQQKIGMWQDPGIFAKLLGRSKEPESPRAYKTRMMQQEKQASK
jgi:endonuclease YncB( thermonuclease family)